jgi:hypothetical protein
MTTTGETPELGEIGISETGGIGAAVGVENSLATAVAGAGVLGEAIGGGAGLAATGTLIPQLVQKRTPSSRDLPQPVQLFILMDPRPNVPIGRSIAQSLLASKKNVRANCPHTVVREPFYCLGAFCCAAPAKLPAHGRLM